MNPFTHFLAQWSGDDRGNGRLQSFITHWDALERLTVQVYRQKLTPEAAQTEYAHVWPWLRQHYGEWAETLRPYWQQTRTAGGPTATDPFQLLLDIPSPQAILGDWRAMQHLPAAREALNQYLRASQ